MPSGWRGVDPLQALFPLQVGKWRAFWKVSNNLYQFIIITQYICICPIQLCSCSDSFTRSAEKEAGFRFCRGLYHRYMNKPQDALIDLNFARQRDPDYRADALVQMIEVPADRGERPAGRAELLAKKGASGRMQRPPELVPIPQSGVLQHWKCRCRL